MDANPSPRRSSTRSPKPLVIRRGACAATIYSSTNTVAGRDYTQFTLVYGKPSGGRVRRKFSDLDEAKREAELILTKMANGETDVLKLTNADRTHYVESLEALKPWGLSLHAAISTLTEALKRLPKDATLLEAVEDFARRHPESMPKKSVAETVEEFITDRRSGGNSDVHLRDLRIRLGQFQQSFQVPIASVTPAAVREFIRTRLNEKTGKPTTNRTKQNLLRMVVSLFNFARKQRYVTRDLADEIAEIESPKAESAPIEVFTPTEFKAILAAADEAVLPALAIGGFAGLRTAEIARLDWRHINVPEGHIVIEAKNAKTGARRIVPMVENLKEWLKPYVRPFGPVNPASNDPYGNALGDRFERAASRAKVKWKRNPLRHSFISYRVAVVKDVPQVALEAGNSPTVIFSNYRALATEAVATAWFSILPQTEKQGVIVPLPLALAG